MKQKKINSVKLFICVQKLPRSERQVVELHYGIDQGYYYSFAIIADRIYNTATEKTGISRGRVQQLKDDAIEQLRAMAPLKGFTVKQIEKALKDFRKGKVLRGAVHIKPKRSEITQKAMRK